MPSQTSREPSSPSAPSIRWWPALGIVVLMAAVVAWTWSGDATSRQDRVVTTLVTLTVGVLLFLVWLLFGSRLSRRSRLAGLGVVVIAVLAAKATLEIRGFTGDMVPIVRWRWTTSGDFATPERTQPALATATFEMDPASDFPQYLGPYRNATLPGIRLARDWQATPPRELWRSPVGAGWSGFAVVGSAAVTLEQRGPEETVTCYDLETGDARWTHAETTRFENTLGGVGPRATPAIAGGRVYALGATGRLSVLDLATGELLWGRDVVADNGAEIPTYGVAASPLVLDDRVLIVAGGPDGRSLVAYDAVTGERRFSGGDDPAAYSSPVLATLAGVPQILVFTQLHLNGHNPETGDVLWQVDWPQGTEKTSQPLPLPGDRIFLSSGYGIGAKLFHITREPGGTFSPELVWESPRLKAKFTNVVFHQGYIYGLDDGVLVSLDPATGERMWKRGRFGHGHVLLVGDLLLVESERGEVILIDPRPDAYSELGRFQAVEGKSWNTPTLAGSRLLIRNAEEAACYELPTLPVD